MSDQLNDESIHHTIIDHYELFIKTRDYLLTLLVIGSILLIAGVVGYQFTMDVSKDMLNIINETEIIKISFMNIVEQSVKLGFIGITSASLSMVIGSIIIVYSSGVFYITIIQGKKKKQEIIDSHHELIRRSYFLNFELVGFEGKTRLDKIFNHAAMVFPELKKTKTYKRFLKGKSVPKMKDRRISNKINKTWFDYDLAIKTISGVFVFKTKETINFLELKKIIDDVNSKQFVQKFFNEPVIRVICVAKSFDESIKNETFEKEFLEISKKGDYKVDLIEENENSYSDIWID